MKILLTFIAVCFTMLLSAQQFTTDDPSEYSNYMVQEQMKLAQKVIALTQASVSTDDVVVVNNKRKEVIAQLDESIKKIENMAPLGGKSDYRDEILTLFKRYKEVYVGAYVELTTLMGRKNTSIADLEAYVVAQEKINKDLNTLEKEVSKSQKKFADEYNMTMSENPIALKMRKIGEANAYAHVIFMEYLKVAKENEKFSNALEAQEPMDMKKARTDMMRVTVPAVRRMETFKGHENYNGFRDAGVKLAQFYEKMARDDYQVMIECIELFKTEPTTNEEVDKYNAAVEKFNNIVNKMNAESIALMNEFNGAQNELINRSLQD